MTCAHRAHQMERRLRIISILRTISCLRFCIIICGIISLVCLICGIPMEASVCIATVGVQELCIICGGTICGIICSIILFFCIICGTPMEQRIASVGVCIICGIISFFCIIYLRPRWTWINASRV